MSGLRCWPGALAYIVAPWACRSEHGLQVTVLRQGTLGERVESRGGYGSRCEGPSLGGCHVGWLCDGRGSRFPRFIADECLRPLLPPPGAEDTPTTADKPQPVEA
jgi:hypothetical protein